MSQHHRPGFPPGHRRGAWRWALVGLATAVLTSGCSQSTVETIQRGWLPGTDQTTSMNRTVRDLWVGSWVAALAIGVLVWGLTIYCVVRFRRRKGETGLPPQMRYNVPLEILYTLVPLFMIGVLFFYTARDQIEIERPYKNPDVRVEVVAKRWSWDFNYLDAHVYATGLQAQSNGKGVQEDLENTIPVMYLPVGAKVQVIERSRDVNHSFWVPAFNYKKDVIPGRTNYWYVTPQRQGTYIGRCAELCGEYHSQMLFKVAVVSQARYQQEMRALRDAGQTGALPVTLGYSDLNPRLGMRSDQQHQGEGATANDSGDGSDNG